MHVLLQIPFLTAGVFSDAYVRLISSLILFLSPSFLRSVESLGHSYCSLLELFSKSRVDEGLLKYSVLYELQ